jgi:acyl-CoA reductase-like NAD-dependent aldehyde dehydrogenase
MNEYTLLINGKSVAANQQIDVINPATEKVFATAPSASKQQVDEAVTAARHAFKTWRNSSLAQRKDVLSKIAKKVNEYMPELAKLLSQEQGKTLENAVSEIEYSASKIETLFDLELPSTQLQDDDEARVIVEHRPIGVVAAINPWNYPVMDALGKIATALFTGNTVVVKPSPYTPLSTLRLGELIRDIVPAGTVNILSGDDQVGIELTNHPLVGTYSFTGSVPTGRAIAKVAAEGLRTATLELGGNDPAIVLPDVDIDEVAEKLFWGAFSNTGQICIAIKRLYVHEDIVEPLVAKMKQIAESIKLGEGTDESTQLGPINNANQLKIVTDLLEDAVQHGARVVTGGKRLDQPGYFFPPTIVTNIKEGVRLVDEEQFGPVLPVITYTDIDDAIERANNTQMGLGASVWSSDWHKAAEIASKLESGTAWVNRAFKTHKYAPFGGVKQSGIGREGGLWGLSGLTELQTISIAKS